MTDTVKKDKKFGLTNFVQGLLFSSSTNLVSVIGIGGSAGEIANMIGLKSLLAVGAVVLNFSGNFLFGMGVETDMALKKRPAKDKTDRNFMLGVILATTIGSAATVPMLSESYNECVKRDKAAIIKKQDFYRAKSAMKLREKFTLGSKPADETNTIRLIFDNPCNNYSSAKMRKHCWSKYR